MRLAEIVGNRRVVERLGSLLASGRLSHAVILEGPPGCGRRTLAIALAQTQLCPEAKGGDACGDCASCRQVAEGNHPDVTVLPAASVQADLPVALVREAVVDAATASSLMGRGRAFVIPDAERMKGPSANALLKVLEEPPPGTRFILTTRRAAGMLSTIRSRSQRYRLHALGDDELVTVLIRQGLGEAEARRRLAAGHGGGVREVLAAGGVGAAPLSGLRGLLDAGYDAPAIAGLMEALPDAKSVPAESTLAKEQRRALAAWLEALLRQLRQELRGEDPEYASQLILRVLRAGRDLDRYIQPRLVLESLSLG